MSPIENVQRIVQRKLMEYADDGLRGIISQGGDRASSLIGYTSPRQEPQSLCSSVLIIKCFWNTCIKPILYKRRRQQIWLTCSQTHVITILRKLLHGNEFPAWHFGQHFLFSLHINNRHFNLLRLIIICSLEQRSSRRKVSAVWRYTESLLFPQMKEYKVWWERC